MFRSICKLSVAVVLVAGACNGAWAADSGSAQPGQPTSLPQQPLGSAHQGVMAPPATGDAAINKGAPSAQHFPTPVIHPSQTPKNQPVIPKKE